ncbi:hypothetical protein N0V90_008720 [Kalmusia sp. IMI 367209]|nr:hypothetical protein N0V90_008720 [Kalmusia sp. IMI 367209]
MTPSDLDLLRQQPEPLRKINPKHSMASTRLSLFLADITSTSSIPQSPSIQLVPILSRAAAAAADTPTSTRLSGAIRSGGASRGSADRPGSIDEETDDEKRDYEKRDDEKRDDEKRDDEKRDDEKRDDEKRDDEKRDDEKRNAKGQPSSREPSTTKEAYQEHKEGIAWRGTPAMFEEGKLGWLAENGLRLSVLLPLTSSPVSIPSWVDSLRFVLLPLHFDYASDAIAIPIAIFHMFFSDLLIFWRNVIRMRIPLMVPISPDLPPQDEKSQDAKEDRDHGRRGGMAHIHKSNVIDSRVSEY